MASRSLAVWVGAALALAASARSTTALEVIPRPQSVSERPGESVWLRDGTRILAPPHDAGALSAARWLAELSLASRGLNLVVAPRAAGPAIYLVREPGPATGESYSLDIDAKGVTIAAASDAGLLHGVATLWQLITGDDGRGPVRLTGVHIEDAPRFAWRGLLLDSARHMQSPAFIERLIDWMALHKLNVLQWHLTDDQGWRLEAPAFPRLTEVGAWRAAAEGGSKPYGGYYSMADVRQVVAHARARGVTVVPEIEMPGHALAAIVAYPELSAGPPPPAAMMTNWGTIPDAFGVDEHVFDFLETVLGEVLQLFPSRYIAVGGDEVPLAIWKAAPGVQARMRALGLADEAALQNYFMSRVAAFLSAHGRRMVGWEEILQGGPLPPGAVVKSWRGVQSAVSATSAGHDVVMAISPTLYFDNRQSALPDEPPGRGWVVTLKDVYALDPGSPPAPPAIPGAPAFVPLDEAQRAHVIGVEGDLWTERMASEAVLTHMAFPRAAAVAEAGWTPQAQRSWPDFVARLPAEFRRFATLGLEESRSVFAVGFTAEPDGAGARVTLTNQTDAGAVRYTLDGREPNSGSALYSGPFQVDLPADLRAATFVDDRRVSPVLEARLDARRLATRVSQQLTLCPGTLPLNLQGASDAQGRAPVFMVQIMNPCWIWPAAQLDGVTGLRLEAIATRFNLQLGSDIAKVNRRASTTGGDEFQVRLDDCEKGRLLAVLPLGVGRARTRLATGLPPIGGRHDLCLVRAGVADDPIWGVDSIELIHG